MHGAFHASEVEIALLRGLDYVADLAHVVKAVRPADGCDIRPVRRLKLVELTPYARINLIVALAVAAHAALYAVADVGGGQEDYPAFPLKTVIEVDEVVKHIVVKLVAFVENQQGAVHLHQALYRRVEDVAESHAGAAESHLPCNLP